MAQKEDIVFPKGFLWGTATAAHQIEGGTTNNNWWLFEKEGTIKNNDSALVACDHWNRFKQDFDLLKKLNCNAYRMSIEWSRVFPQPGTLDKKALDHYVTMINELLKRKITPFVTLFHFTLPIWWCNEGGLLNRDKKHLEHFKQFCDVVAKTLKGKVKFYNTINEPSIVMLGYITGTSAPGQKNMLKAIKALGTTMLMHAIAYHTIKSVDPDAKVGIVHNVQITKPYNPDSIMDKLFTAFADYCFNGAIIRSLKKGKLPLQIFSSHRELINTNDFIGVNFYNFIRLSLRLKDLAIPATDNPICGKKGLCVSLGWEPYPEGFYLAIKRMHNAFPHIPMYITENGIGTNDDSWRQRVLIDHLKMLHKAITEGVDIRGYFYWSLIDNFEWEHGYEPRFGLVHVDFKTQKRTIKPSGMVYAHIAKSNALPAAILKKFPEEIYKPQF